MLTVRNLCLERYFQAVFDPVSFELNRGELLIVTGPNGAGKTTLIRLLAGLLNPTDGEVENTLDHISYLGHEAGIKAELSVRENLAFSRSLSDEKGDVDAAMSALGIKAIASQAGRTLSAGQRKRTALARLVLSRAPLWLLDEPYTNMDADGIAIVDEMLAEHLATGGACVMSTHGGHRPLHNVHPATQFRELALSPGASLKRAFV